MESEIRSIFGFSMDKVMTGRLGSFVGFCFCKEARKVDDDDDDDTQDVVRHDCFFFLFFSTIES
jgi:hypothetical protein